MKSPCTVPLQQPLSYMPGWLVLAGLLVVAVILMQVIARRRRRRAGENLPIRLRPASEAQLPGIKERYLDTLGAIERDLREGKTEPRFAYQRMSGAIRGFVYEATGVKVQKYTLYEIKQLRIHRLTQLIEEYYVPEFAEWSQQDALASLHRTEGVIQGWH